MLEGTKKTGVVIQLLVKMLNTRLFHVHNWFILRFCCLFSLKFGWSLNWNMSINWNIFDVAKKVSVCYEYICWSDSDRFCFYHHAHFLIIFLFQFIKFYNFKINIFIFRNFDCFIFSSNTCTYSLCLIHFKILQFQL